MLIISASNLSVSICDRIVDQSNFLVDMFKLHDHVHIGPWNDNKIERKTKKRQLVFWELVTTGAKEI